MSAFQFQVSNVTARSWIRILLAILVLFGSLAARAASTIGLSARLNERVVFDWRTQRCARTDIPDANVRALRDSRGEIWLFSTHEDNREFVGTSFRHLKHPCDVVYVGNHSADPAVFNDRQWINSIYSVDGKHVMALIHNELHAYLHKALCKSRNYARCWWNTITVVKSNDGGQHFYADYAPANVVASLPYKYVPDYGKPVGYFQPSNVIRGFDGYEYFMFHASDYKAQKRGTCLLRTRTPMDAKSWRGWDGIGFNVIFKDPYTDAIQTPAKHVCAVVGFGRIFNIGTILVDRARGRYISITSIPHGSGNKLRPPGVYYSFSDDMINWSSAQLLLRESDILDVAPMERASVGYFSLIDQSSKSFDFDDVSSNPALFLYYVVQLKQNAPYARELIKIPVSFTEFDLK